MTLLLICEIFVIEVLQMFFFLFSVCKPIKKDFRVGSFTRKGKRWIQRRKTWRSQLGIRNENKIKEVEQWQPTSSKLETLMRYLRKKNSREPYLIVVLFSLVLLQDTAVVIVVEAVYYLSLLFESCTNSKLNLYFLTILGKIRKAITKLKEWTNDPRHLTSFFLPFRSFSLFFPFHTWLTIFSIATMYAGLMMPTAKEAIKWERTR